MKTDIHSRRLSAPIRGIRDTCCAVTVLFCFGVFYAPIFVCRERGNIPSCLSHIKQLDLGLQMYAQDYDERFPQASQWMDATLPYIKNEEVYHCPEVVKHAPAGYGYVFNSAMSTVELPIVDNPAQAPLIYDADRMRRNAQAPGLIGLANPPRHQEGNGVGYADGHAKWIRTLSMASRLPLR